MLNKPNPKLDSILSDINAKTGLRNSSNVVAEKKQEIFNLLKTEIAEGIDDEQKLEQLKMKLEEKKALFEKNLGLGTVKFRDNTDVAKLRNDTAYKATSRDNSALQKKVLNTLDTFQHLDVGNLKWTLFGGKNLNIANVHANLALPDISKVLSATTNIDTEIDHFVQNVHKNSNPFLIQSSKLYTKPDDTQREVAIRMALYLYRIYWLADQGKLNDAQAAAFEKIINDLQNNEIPQFKGIYNVKKELEYLYPEHALIADMNTKLGDINKGNLHYTGATINQEYDLKDEFETTSTTDYKSYTLQAKDIKPSSLKLVDASGNSNDTYTITPGAIPVPLTIKLEVNGIPTDIGTFTFIYAGGEVKCTITLKDGLSPEVIDAIKNTDFSLPITALKGVAGGITGASVALTKALLIGFGTLTPYPTSPHPTSPHPTSPHPTSPHPTSPHPTSPHPTSPHPTSPHPTSPHPTSPHPTSPYSTSVYPPVGPERIVLSDVTSLREHQIKMQVVSEIRQKFNAVSKRNVLSRLGYFMSRDRRVRKETEKRLEAEKNNSRPFTMNDPADNELTAAADRHAGDTTLATNTITLDPVFQAEIDRLASEYIDPARVPLMADNELKTQFNYVISQDPAFRGANFTEKFFSTNILRVLQAKRAERELDIAVNKALELQFNEPTNPAVELNYTKLYHKVSEYVRNFGRDPVFRAELDNLLSGVSDGQTLDRRRLANYLNHINGCARLRINNARLQIDMITEGKGAYEIRPEHTGRHRSRTTKVGAWMDKHRWITTGGIVGVSALTAIATAGIGGVLMGASVGGLISTGVGSGLIGATNYFKKKAHYTKEVDEYEKRNAMNHQAEAATMQHRRDIVEGRERANRFQRMKARKQLNKYEKTTVQDLADTQALATALKDLSAIPTQNLTPLQKNQLNALLIQSYAMTEMFRQHGRNFLSSQTEAQAEQDMVALEKAIDLGAGRAGLANRTAIADPAFTAIVNGETRTVDNRTAELTHEYDDRLKNFKKKREKLAVQSGLTTAAISFATSAALQKVLGTGMFAKEAVSGTEAQNLTHTTNAGKETVGLGGHNLTDGSNNLFTTAKDGLDNANIQGQIKEIIINPASGTDATLVKVGKFTNRQDKMNEVISEVSRLHHIPDQSSVIDQIKQIPAELAKHPDFSKFQNGNLEIMRVLEATEQSLKAYDVSSIAGQGTILIKPDLAQSIAGNLVKEQSQRFLESTITINSEIAGEAAKTGGNKFLTRFIPVFSNTSKLDTAANPSPSPSPSP